jgi:AcrR family transcriptional regulator
MLRVVSRQRKKSSATAEGKVVTAHGVQGRASRSAPSAGSSRLARGAPDEGTRERMVAGAARLLAERGLQATSFSEILDLTSSPRGSVYHHFPAGKDQLVTAALDLVEAQMGKYFAPPAGASPEEVTVLFLHLWRGILQRSQFKAGCAVVAVTVAADSPGLLKHVGKIFRTWRRRLADLLALGGLSAGDAGRFAATLIAASEGAVVLSRAEQTMEPFDLVASHLVEQARSFSGTRRPR